MPYGDTSALPTTVPWSEPPPSRRAGSVLPLVLATLLSFAAGVASTLVYLEATQREFAVAEAPLVEADKAPTRVRPEGLAANGTAVAAAPAAASPSNLPSPISAAMAMAPPVPAIDLPAQGVPVAPEIVPPARAQVIELAPAAPRPAPAAIIPASQPASPPPAGVSPLQPETRIQIASLRTHDKAVEEMNRFRRVHAGLVANLEFEVQRLDLGERGIFHRVLSGPVGERAEGAALCTALAERRAQCQVVTLRSRPAAAEIRIALAPPAAVPAVVIQPVEPPQQTAAPAAEPPRAEVRAQLASLRTLEGATRELNRLAKLYGGVLEQTELSVSRIDQGERGVFYRVLTGPLPSRDAAGEFCQRLGDAHHAGCVLIAQLRPTA
jgi:hypothetical protein